DEGQEDAAVWDDKGDCPRIFRALQSAAPGMPARPRKAQGGSGKRLCNLRGGAVHHRPLSSLRDRVFCQNLFDPLERFFGGSLRGHSLSDHISCGQSPSLGRLALGVTRIVNGILRNRWTQQSLLRVSGYMLVLGIEPERFCLDELGDRRKPSAEPAFEISVCDLRLDQVFGEIFGDFDVLSSLGDEAAANGKLGGKQLAVIVE